MPSPSSGMTVTRRESIPGSICGGNVHARSARHCMNVKRNDYFARPLAFVIALSIALECIIVFDIIYRNPTPPARPFYSPDLDHAGIEKRQQAVHETEEARRRANEIGYRGRADIMELALLLVNGFFLAFAIKQMIPTVPPRLKHHRLFQRRS